MVNKGNQDTGFQERSIRVQELNQSDALRRKDELAVKSLEEQLRTLTHHNINSLRFDGLCSNFYLGESILSPAEGRDFDRLMTLLKKMFLDEY